MSRTAAPYTNPYLAGVGIGFVMLAAFVLFGRGLGASGAFARVFDTNAGSLLDDWLVVQVIGIALGGFASALIARRLRVGTEHGPHINSTSRLLLAFGGGTIMSFGARLARGCTSGLGLTGGALLSVGSWLFVLAAFAAGYAFAPLVRRTWQ
jgi:uncharacterized membrane protein YedE/YeeE